MSKKRNLYKNNYRKRLSLTEDELNNVHLNIKLLPNGNIKINNGQSEILIEDVIKIYKEYNEGSDIKAITEKFNSSEDTIKKIITFYDNGIFDNLIKKYLIQNTSKIKNNSPFNNLTMDLEGNLYYKNIKSKPILLELNILHITELYQIHRYNSIENLSIHYDISYDLTERLINRFICGEFDNLIKFQNKNEPFQKNCNLKDIYPIEYNIKKDSFYIQKFGSSNFMGKIIIDNQLHILNFKKSKKSTQKEIFKYFNINFPEHWYEKFGRSEVKKDNFEKFILLNKLPLFNNKEKYFINLKGQIQNEKYTFKLNIDEIITCFNFYLNQHSTKELSKMYHCNEDNIKFYINNYYNGTFDSFIKEWEKKHPSIKIKFLSNTHIDSNKITLDKQRNIYYDNENLNISIFNVLNIYRYYIANVPIKVLSNYYNTTKTSIEKVIYFYESDYLNKYLNENLEFLKDIKLQKPYKRVSLNYFNEIYCTNAKIKISMEDLKSLSNKFLEGSSIKELSSSLNISTRLTRRYLYRYLAGDFKKAELQWYKTLDGIKYSPDINDKNKYNKLISLIPINETSFNELIKNYKILNKKFDYNYSIKDYNISLRSISKDIYHYKIISCFNLFLDGYNIEEIGKKLDLKTHITKKNIIDYSNGTYDEVIFYFNLKYHLQLMTKNPQIINEGAHILHLNNNGTFCINNEEYIGLNFLDILCIYRFFIANVSIKSLSHLYQCSEEKIEKIIYNFQKVGTFNSMFFDLIEIINKYPPYENLTLTNNNILKSNNKELKFSMNFIKILINKFFKKEYLLFFHEKHANDIAKEFEIPKYEVSRIIFRYIAGDFKKVEDEWILTQNKKEKISDNLEVYIEKHTDIFWASKFRKNGRIYFIDYAHSKEEAELLINNYFKKQKLPTPLDVKIIDKTLNINEKTKTQNTQEKTKTQNTQEKTKSYKNSEIQVFILYKESDDIFIAKYIENSITKTLAFTFSLKCAEKHIKKFLKGKKIDIPKNINVINKN